jgi:hypothetical protein
LKQKEVKTITVQIAKNIKQELEIHTTGTTGTDLGSFFRMV